MPCLVLVVLRRGPDHMGTGQGGQPRTREVNSAHRLGQFFLHCVTTRDPDLLLLPCRLIPVPMVGFKELLRRLKIQEQMTKQHQTRVDVSGAITDHHTIHSNHSG